MKEIIFLYNCEIINIKVIAVKRSTLTIEFISQQFKKKLIFASSNSL